MTPELVQAAKTAAAQYIKSGKDFTEEGLFQAVIAVIAPAIRAQALEEAAKLADDSAAFEAKCFRETDKEEEEDVYDRGAYVARTCAAAIRALILSEAAPDAS